MGRIADIKEMVKFQNLSLLKKKKRSSISWHQHEEAADRIQVGVNEREN